MSDDIRQMREELGIGIQEAVRIRRGEDLIARIHISDWTWTDGFMVEANPYQQLDNLRAVLLDIVADHYPARPPKPPALS